MITKYHPMKIVGNHLDTIGTLSFFTKKEAVEYAKTRGLKEEEIHIQLYEWDEHWYDEWEGNTEEE